VSDLLTGKTPIKARHIRPGQGQAVEVKAGQLLQIQTVQGKQVADFVAFGLGDTEEYLSTSVTMSANSSIIPRQGMTLYSNRRQPMFEIVEDTVGRHDMLYACCDPIRYEMLDAPGHANCREALTGALESYGVGYDRIPTPINWFMSVSIMQRGELELREPLAEKGDYVILRALKDVVAAVSACPQDLAATNAFNPTDILIRVYRDRPLPSAAAEEPVAAAQEPVGEPAPVQDTGEPAATAELATGDEDAQGAARAAAADEVGVAPGAVADVAAEAPEAVADVAVAQEAPAPPARAVGTPRPARLEDTVEATVIRIEDMG
jgi:uncharacterized protein YcgI (DUF1989 family)